MVKKKKNKINILKKIWNILIGFVYSKFFTILINILILVSVFILIINKLMSFPQYYQYYFEVLDMTFVVIFALEFFVKLFNDKKKYFLNDYGWIDMLSVLPIFTPALKSLKSVRLLRVSRLLRLLRLLRFAKANLSPLKQKTFIALSSFTLITILVFGYFISGLQYANFIEQLEKKTILIQNSLKNAENLANFFKIDENILFIIEKKELPETDNYIGLNSQDKLFKFRPYDYKIFSKNLFYKSLKNDSYKNILLKIISEEDFKKLKKKPFLLSEYYSKFKKFAYSDLKLNEKIKAFNLALTYDYKENFYFSEVPNINLLKQKKLSSDIFDNDLIVIYPVQNYKIIYSLKAIKKKLNLFDFYLILLSFVSISVIILTLNFYFEKLILNRITSLYKRVITSLKIYYKDKLYEKIKVEIGNDNDEVDILTNTYNHLVKQVDKNIDLLKYNNNILESFNVVYSYFQNTMDLTKLFNYLLITLTCKKFLSYDRCALYLLDAENNEYKFYSGIGHSSRSSLVECFPTKNEFYKYDPDLKEALEQYTDSVYYSKSFNVLLSKIAISGTDITEDIKLQFQKNKNVLKCPLEVKYDTELFKQFENVIASDEYLIILLEIYGKPIGLLYVDNKISQLKISINRIKNTLLFIDEFNRFITNIVRIQFAENFESLKEIKDVQKKEKENNEALLKNIYEEI